MVFRARAASMKAVKGRGILTGPRGHYSRACLNRVADLDTGTSTGA